MQKKQARLLLGTAILAAAVLASCTGGEQTLSPATSLAPTNSTLSALANSHTPLLTSENANAVEPTEKTISTNRVETSLSPINTQGAIQTEAAPKTQTIIAGTNSVEAAEPTTNTITSVAQKIKPTASVLSAQSSSPEISTSTIATKASTVIVKPPQENSGTRFANTGAVPAGFEDLMSEQTSLVDIYYADRYLTSAMATFTMDSVTLHSSGTIVEQLSDILDVEAVKLALAEELPTNQELMCFSKSQRNCGVLNPEVAGIIFDSDKFKGEIFINQSLLAVKQLERNLYLPPSDGGLSYLQTLNYAFSGDEGEFHNDSNLFSLSLLSYKENSLRMTSNYDEVDGLTIDSLTAQRDWRGIRTAGGYFQSNSQDLRFTAEKPLLGIRVGTSIDTRDDQRQSSGRSIQVFLQSRGDVAIYKDGRLISSQIYDAGNQVIDTSSLPGGAYDIELRISDSGGDRIETRFYTKNFRMPPQDQPRYFVELGKVTQESLDSSLPEKTGEMLLRGSYNQRLNHANALLTGFSTTEDDSVAEMGWFTLSEGYEVLLNSAIAKHKRYALSTETRFNIFNTWLNASYRQIWDKNESTDNLAPIFGPTNLIGQAQKQASLGFSVNYFATNLSLSSRYNKRDSGESSTDHSARLSREIARFRNSNLRGSLEYNHSSDNKTILASINWSARGDHWSSSLSPQVTSVKNANGNRINNERLTGSANWNSKDMWASDLRLGVNGSEDREQQSVGVNMDLAGTYGRSRFQVERSGPKDGYSRTRHNGNLSTSFTIADSSISLGAKDQNQAAVIVDMREAAEGMSFDVLINNGKRGTASSGQKTLISLRPFETYRVRLKPRGTEFVYFNDKEQVVTLYPGNVVQLEWQADRVNILFGRLLDQDNQPISNALLKGVSGLSTTDEYGLFQAEVKESVKEIKVETRTQTCKVMLPNYTTNQGVASVGTLQCELSEKSRDQSIQG